MASCSISWAIAHEERGDRHGDPPGENAGDVGGGRADHGERRDGEDAGTERVLVTQDRVPVAQLAASGAHGDADALGALGVVERDVDRRWWWRGRGGRGEGRGHECDHPRRGGGVPRPGVPIS